jgi:predicted RNase H-like HicB family nuclease
MILREVPKMAFENIEVGKHRMGKRSRAIAFRGYTKKEGNHWVAVCIDLNIVAQGSTPEEATKECQALIIEYLHYVCTEYPQELHKYVPRPAPQELIEEYNSCMIGTIRPPTRRINKRPLSFSIETSALASCSA